MGEHIESEGAKAEANRIKRIAKKLKKKNRLQSPKIWEIKRQVTKCMDTPHLIKGKDNQKIDGTPEIIKGYENDFKYPLEIKEAKP